MKAAYLLLLSLVPLSSLLTCPLSWAEGAFVEAASPLPRGEGAPRPASSSVRQPTETVRGLSAQPPRSVTRYTHSSDIRPRPLRAIAPNVHQRVADKPAGAARSVTRATAPTFTNVRHRSPNPAIVGGPAKTQVKATGSLSGTSMNRRR